MTSTISFDSITPRFGLPLLFAAQAQKEVFVNESLALIDALMDGAIEGLSATPPATPTDGTNWLIGASAAGDWAGQDGKLACRQAGNWIFVSPTDGTSVLNRASGQRMHFRGTWHSPALPAAPSGGATVDTEARSALASLITALQTAGIFPSS